MLTRLLKHRRTDLTWLSSTSGVTETELRSLVSGTPPQASQLDGLAAAFRLHAADLCVIAGIAAPEPLTPRDSAAGAAVVGLIRITMALPSNQRAQVNRFVQQLPSELEERPCVTPLIYDPHSAGLGATLANLLCTNRNLHSLAATAKTLAVLTEGRVYLAASTISGIGRGRVPLTANLVAGFATALGIPRGDLAAITGFELAEPSRSDDPLPAETAALLWSCRRLTAVQVGRVRDEAESMLVPVPEGAPAEEWNRVHHHHGRWWGAPRR